MPTGIFWTAFWRGAARSIQTCSSLVWAWARGAAAGDRPRRQKAKRAAKGAVRGTELRTIGDGTPGAPSLRLASGFLLFRDVEEGVAHHSFHLLERYGGVHPAFEKGTSDRSTLLGKGEVDDE